MKKKFGLNVNINPVKNTITGDFIDPSLYEWNKDDDYLAKSSIYLKHKSTGTVLYLENGKLYNIQTDGNYHEIDRWYDFVVFKNIVNGYVMIKQAGVIIRNYNEAVVYFGFNFGCQIYIPSTNQIDLINGNSSSYAFMNQYSVAVHDYYDLSNIGKYIFVKLIDGKYYICESDYPHLYENILFEITAEEFMNNQTFGFLKRFQIYGTNFGWVGYLCGYLFTFVNNNIIYKKFIGYRNLYKIFSREIFMIFEQTLYYGYLPMLIETNINKDINYMFLGSELLSAVGNKLYQLRISLIKVCSDSDGTPIIINNILGIENTETLYHEEEYPVIYTSELGFDIILEEDEEGKNKIPYTVHIFETKINWNTSDGLLSRFLYKILEDIFFIEGVDFNYSMNNGSIKDLFKKMVNDGIYIQFGLNIWEMMNKDFYQNTAPYETIKLNGLQYHVFENITPYTHKLSILQDLINIYGTDLVMVLSVGKGSIGTIGNINTSVIVIYYYDGYWWVGQQGYQNLENISLIPDSDNMVIISDIFFNEFPYNVIKLINPEITMKFVNNYMPTPPQEIVQDNENINVIIEYHNEKIGKIKLRSNITSYDLELGTGVKEFIDYIHNATATELKEIAKNIVNNTSDYRKRYTISSKIFNINVGEVVKLIYFENNNQHEDYVFLRKCEIYDGNFILYATDGYYLEYNVNPVEINEKRIEINENKLITAESKLESLEEVIAFSSFINTSKPLTPNADTKIIYDNEEYDYGNNYDPILGRFTAPVKGIYNFNANISLNQSNWSVNQIFVLVLYKNGSVYKIGYRYEARVNFTSGHVPSMVFSDIFLNKNDYVEVFYHVSPSGIRTFPSASYNRFQGHIIKKIST